jgi:hypothetical protein
VKIYQQLAQLVGALQRCERDGDKFVEWAGKHRACVLAIVKRYFPSGSGFDAGTTIDLDASTEESLRFVTSFHHMTEHGSYDGWTEHDVIVKPSLAHGFHLRVTGRDRNEIKEHIAGEFHEVLSAQVDETLETVASKALGES